MSRWFTFKYRIELKASGGKMSSMNQKINSKLPDVVKKAEFVHFIRYNIYNNHLNNSMIDKLKQLKIVEFLVRHKYKVQESVPSFKFPVTQY